MAWPALGEGDTRLSQCLSGAGLLEMLSPGIESGGAEAAQESHSGPVASTKHRIDPL